MEKTLHLFHRLIIKTNEEVKHQIQIRNQVFLITSLFVLMLGMITTGFNVYYSISHNQLIDTAIYLLSFGVLILAVFGKNISDDFRVTLTNTFLYINGVLMFVQWGMHGTGQLYLFLVPIVAAVLRKKSATIIALLVNLVTLSTMKILLDNDIVFNSELVQYSNYKWFVFTVGFMAFNTLVSIFIYQLVRMFIEKNDEEIKEIEILSDEMEKLSRINAKFQTIINGNQQFEKKDFKTQKLESVGRLTSGIANEFNNLITVIVGYTDILLSISTNDDMYNRLLKKVKIAGKASENLVSKLLAFSKNLVLKNKIININDTLLNLEKTIKARLNDDINLEIDLPDQNYYIKIDPVQLEKIIIELVTNASHALPIGGNIKLKVGKEKCDNSFITDHEMEEVGEYVVISVIDDGVGMNTETKEQAFEPFFSTKQLGEALGLGLSVVYGVVKQCGGEVLIDSAPGNGAEVKILLLSHDDNISFQKDEKIIPTELRGSETILLVEDDKLVRSVMVEVLNNYGYTIISATDGVDGLKIFNENDKTIDLVITDIVMPKMSGTDFVKEIEKIQKDIKVLYMSGYVEKVHDLQHKGLNYIKKPFDPLDLVKKIRFVLDANIVGIQQ